MGRKFEIKDLGDIKTYLGMEVTQSDQGIKLTQLKFIDQLLSRESLERTPWFDADRVVRHYERYRASGGHPYTERIFVAMALMSVAGIQLWYHLYFGGGLCDLPTWTPPSVDDHAAVPSTGVRMEPLVEVSA